MAKLIATRGLPASGKTRLARQWVDKNPNGRASASRDDTRRMLHGRWLGTMGQEQQVTAFRDAGVLALLRSGVDVVCDDTNLRLQYVRNLRRLAALAGADFEVWDLTDVPLETCIERDAARTGEKHVGEAVIRSFHKRHVQGRPHPLPLPEESEDATSDGYVYSPPPGAPSAVMVDIDGTAALMCGRSPYDETRVHEDRPNPGVVAAVRAMHQAGHRIIFCSGRTEACRDATLAWLAEHVDVPYVDLYMRPAGDTRKDSVVKRELFDRHIRDNWNVTVVLDDRNQVVDMWRSIGLTVFQVAPGDF